MRDLTQQEIGQAPDWADKYDVVELSIVPNYTAYYGGDMSLVICHSGAKPVKMHRVTPPDRCKSIPRKEFVHGCNVYLIGTKRCVGRYVGLNPETGSIVTVKGAKFECFRKHQVTQ